MLVRENASTTEAIGTFDFSDLNSYLLLVVGLAHPDQEQKDEFTELAHKARSGIPIPLKDIHEVGRRDTPVLLPESSTLPHAVKILASGVHRILVVKEGTKNVLGVLTQLRLVRFFWEYGRQFPAIEQLFPYALQDLHVGSKAVRSIKCVACPS